MQWELGPYCGDEESGAGGDEAEEEDYDDGVLFVHEVVAQTGARVCDAAIGEHDVEAAECGGDVDDEEAVEEADGCISGLVSKLRYRRENEVYLKAGSRPKKAMNVRTDTAMVKATMLRANVMVVKLKVGKVHKLAWRGRITIAAAQALCTLWSQIYLSQVCTFISYCSGLVKDGKWDEPRTPRSTS